MSKALEILRTVWGFEQFRPVQDKIIQSVLEGRDTVALLPTGGGKSLCYQVPALVLDGLCIVISPLVALMEDQVGALKDLGVNAEAVHSGKSLYDIDRILDNCIYGKTKLLYMAPERLQSQLTEERIKRMPVSFVAVDEAHCISQWGYDFRPSYLEIPVIRQWHPDVPMLALTATATSQVVTDIADKLSMTDAVIHRRSFARENLEFHVASTENKVRRMMGSLKEKPGCSLIYVRSRRKTTELAIELSRQDIRAEAYHAGMKSTDRLAVQQRWLNDVTPVVVCTTAFGMGIDKSDVRQVIHYDLPGSLEEYYQEAGRAGRDGRESRCLLLYNDADVAKLQTSFEQSHPDLPDLQRVYQALASFANIAPGYGEGTSTLLDLGEFARHYQLNPALVFHALKVLERDGWIALSDAFFNPPKIQCTAGRDEVFKYQLANPALGEVLKALMRNYEGVFLEPVKIDVFRLARVLETGKEELEKSLSRLAKDGMINYTPSTDQPRVVFLRPRPVRDNFTIDRKLQDRLRENGELRLQSVLEYLEEQECRQLAILKYFDDAEGAKPCGKCDVCSRRANRLSKEAILKAIGNSGIPVEDVVDKFEASAEKDVAKLLQELASDEIIAIQDRIVKPVKRGGT